MYFARLTSADDTATLPALFAISTTSRRNDDDKVGRRNCVFGVPDEIVHRDTGASPKDRPPARKNRVDEADVLLSRSHKENHRSSIIDLDYLISVDSERLTRRLATRLFPSVFLPPLCVWKEMFSNVMCLTHAR